MAKKEKGSDNSKKIAVIVISFSISGYLIYNMFFASRRSEVPIEEFNLTPVVGGSKIPNPKDPLNPGKIPAPPLPGAKPAGPANASVTPSANPSALPSVDPSANPSAPPNPSVDPSQSVVPNSEASAETPSAEPSAAPGALEGSVEYTRKTLEELHIWRFTLPMNAIRDRNFAVVATLIYNNKVVSRETLFSRDKVKDSTAKGEANVTLTVADSPTDLTNKAFQVYTEILFKDNFKSSVFKRNIKVGNINDLKIKAVASTPAIAKKIPLFSFGNAKGTAELVVEAQFRD